MGQGGERGAAIGQLTERDLCSSSADLYSIGCRGVLVNSGNSFSGL